MSEPIKPQTSSNGGAASGAAATEAQHNSGILASRFPRLHARYSQVTASRLGRASAFTWKRRRPIAIGLALTYGLTTYAYMRWEAYKRDTIHPDSWLVLKVHPGSIVECKSASGLASLLHTPSPGDDMPQVMNLFDLCRTIKYAQTDERIRGIYADFGGLHVPTEVSPSPLGLAQIEEIVEALHEFKIAKKLQRKVQGTIKMLSDALSGTSEKAFVEEAKALMERVTNGEDLDEILDIKNKTNPTAQGIEPVQKEEKSLTSPSEKQQNSKESSEGQLIGSSIIETLRQIRQKEMDTPDEPVTIAWTDTFTDQRSYLLASAFDEVYIQPSGDVPLTGLVAQLPFVKRALDWLGIKIHSETRRDYKSVNATFVNEDGLTPAQLRDDARLYGELGRSMAHSIGVNRFPSLSPEEAAEKVLEISSKGPYSAAEAKELGLVTDLKYKSEVVKLLGEEPKLRSINSYGSIMTRTLDRVLNEDQSRSVAVVYLLGGISSAPGEFSASQAIKGLREAGEDEDVSAIVLRIDSGGGSALTSDSLWDAVRRAQVEFNKPVVASFGNMSASGGYYASACADYIMACESTVTGSIGVASLRPTITKKFFDRLGVSFQTLFTGNESLSLLHEMTDDELKKHAKHTDEVYDLFLDKVCSGRSIDRGVVEDLAGGRVWTGLAAWIKCNPDRELVREHDISDARMQSATGEESHKDENKQDEEAAAATTEKIEEPVKAISLSSDWNTVDVSRTGEMSTMKIVPEPFADGDRQKGMPRSTEEDEDEGIQGFVREVAAHLPSDTETSLNNLSAETSLVPSTSAGASAVDANKMIDEDSKLAVKAHEEAVETHTSEKAGNEGNDRKVGSQAQEMAKLGPYGRGLIDSIGGIWDATYKAYSLAVQREIDELVKEGKTEEEALASIMPGADRVVGPEGVAMLDVDLRLVRYPRERKFLERVRELNRKGDEPQMSIASMLFSPSFLRGLGIEVREYVTDMAVQLLVRSWSDPAFVRRVHSAMQQEQNVKMEYQSHIYS